MIGKPQSANTSAVLLSSEKYYGELISLDALTPFILIR